MIVDWNLVTNIAVPVGTLLLGIWLDRRFELRPRLVTYYGHVAAFSVDQPHGQPPLAVHTHSVVLRNTGRRSATDVRIRHQPLQRFPHFVIWPHLQHHVEDVPGGGREIVIPILVPNEEITISYLYFPPTTVAHVHAGIRSAEGFARAIPVLLQRQFPRWVNRVAWLVVVVGVMTIIYLVLHALIWLVHQAWLIGQ
jgi:hypothetical protein